MRLLFTISMLFCTILAYSQNNISVKGKVTEKETGQPAIGTSIIVKGTSIGEIVNLEGEYELTNVPVNATLVFSGIGKSTQEIAVGGRTVINAIIEEDSQLLEQSVVIGYGTAKAKDLTAPITVIKAEAIANRMTASPMEALQGKAAGLQIINSGTPGASPTVRVRGVGTFDPRRGGPLYVVDGMFYDSIPFLNNNDIEDVTILKDASSSSIYGVRASNGVVIITMKKGTFGAKPKIVYNGSVGVQTVSRRLRMANSAEYATMQLEKYNKTDSARILSSINVFGGQGLIPGVSTDWYRELLRTAVMHNHDIGISGGSEKISYSFGINYLYQDGIMKADNNYSRFNFRSRMDVQAYSWLKLGVSLVASNIKQVLPEDGAWRGAFVAPPTFPVYDRNNTIATPVSFASPAQIGYSSFFGNPVAMAYYNDQIRRNFQVLPTFYTEFTILPSKLTFRTSYAQDVSILQTSIFRPIYVVGGDQKRTDTELEKTNDIYSNYIWDNILTYRDSYNKHNYTAMLGHSLRSESWRMLRGTANGVPSGKDEYMYLDLGNPSSRVARDNGSTYRGLSYFGRLAYDYDGRYMISASMRIDGSSKYQEKWGYFPSLGTAWVISEEDFFKNQNFFDFLKFRIGWGVLGNDKVEANNGSGSITRSLETTGVFGGKNTQSGYTISNLFSTMRWEKTSELNIGLDYVILDNRLKGEIDFFRRETKYVVFQVPVAMTSTRLLGNNGTIRNTGFEFTLNWSDEIGKDFAYNVGTNVSFLKNKVVYLNGLERVFGTDIEFATISELGGTLNSFYGNRVLGVYQNQAQVDADPIAVDNKLKPGDFIYEDVNHDGLIDDLDRVDLGSYLPKVVLGFTMGFTYKNFDFNMVIQGQFGNKIANKKRGLRRWQGEINYDRDMVVNRWRGEGTSNKYPSAEGTVNAWNIARFNSFLVENGSNLSIQNISVGYTFQELFPKYTNIRLRVGLMAERPINFFSYNGFTTDVPNGIDEQVYPLPSIYSLGVKLVF